MIDLDGWSDVDLEPVSVQKFVATPSKDVSSTLTLIYPSQDLPMFGFSRILSLQIMGYIYYSLQYTDETL
jgi:hypothetical protein